MRSTQRLLNKTPLWGFDKPQNHSVLYQEGVGIHRLYFNFSYSFSQFIIPWGNSIKKLSCHLHSK